MDDIETDGPPRPTVAMVRRYYGLPHPDDGTGPRRRKEEFDLRLASSGGVSHHIDALARLLRSLEDEELAHQVRIRSPQAPLVEVLVRVHWGLGEWVQVIDSAGCLTDRQRRALRDLCFTPRPTDDLSVAGRGQEHSWYSDDDRLDDLLDVALHALAIWEIIAIDADAHLTYSVAPVEPEVTIEQWLDDFCDDEMAAEVIATAGRP